MLRLTLFGGVALVRDGVPVSGAAGRRRALACLALLAASRPRGLSRERLCALLWPDADDEAARHSLHQLLFTTRRAVGVDGLVVGTATLSLDPAAIACDVWEFERALQDRQLERAVALYAGPLADGFAPEDVPEAAERLDTLRATYAREYAAALEQLATAAADRGDPLGAARWWRLLCDAEPLRSTSARALVASLAAGGERAEAVRFARVHVELVRRELGAEPDAEILAWMARLQDQPPREARPVLAPVAPPAATDAARHGRLRTLLERAAGPRYQVADLVEESTLFLVYAGTAREGRGEAVELGVVQPRAAAHAAAARFTVHMGRVARLVDPHLLPVFDAGASDDLLWYATARRPALSLRERLRAASALPVDEAVAVARGVAAALGSAHADGLRHGDLRPRHVYLAPGGRGPHAMLRGVGLADALRGDERAGDRSTAAAVGVPAYQSPEQLAGDATWDARSDVYALGAILYEMLAGEPPFGRDLRAAGVARKLTGDPAPIRERRDRVSERLAAVVHTCLARVAADRYANGGEVGRALAEAM